MSGKKSDGFNGIYAELAEIIGVETVEQIYSQYKGQQITFPMRLYSKAYTEKQICAEFDGKNYRELAQKYEYSERWIREIIKSKII